MDILTSSFEMFSIHHSWLELNKHLALQSRLSLEAKWNNFLSESRNDRVYL